MSNELILNKMIDVGDGNNIVVSDFFKYIQFYNEDLNKKQFEFIKILFRKFNFLGMGRNRIVFKLKGDYVIKVPICENGIYDNIHEGSIFTNKNDKNLDKRFSIVYPRTKLFILDQEIACVIMDLVKPLMISEERELRKNSNDYSWFDFVDCGQVGRLKNGKIVAFDYGLN